ncbi:MAG: right-handed parallel beta-helix repeat-containing protein [Bacteroidota bacterium]
MKSFRASLSLFLLLILSLSAVPRESNALQAGTAFYVSLTGNDTWSGKLPSPNENKTDGPFATLERAREAIRSLRQAGAPPRGGAVVYVRGGQYRFSKTFKLTAADSGGKGTPITWRAYSNEQVSFTGGKYISGFKTVTDSLILKRIDSQYRDKIMVVDLKAQGIADFGAIVPRGSPPLEVFFQGRRLTIARWPNSGWLKIADVPQTGDTLYNQGLEREKRFDGVPVGRHYGRIKYDGDRPSRWSSENEVYLHGYWTWDWSDSFQKVKLIDTLKREITLQPPHHHYGYTKNQRYYFLNILEELDEPGEWYLDRKNELLYFWPLGPLMNRAVTVSLLDVPLVSIENSSNITIQGIRFEYSRGSGITIIGGNHNMVAGCTFRNLGADAVKIDGGTENGIQSCDISEVALGGVLLNGGDRKTLTPGGNFAINNHIYNYSTWLRTGQYAIVVDGVGNRVAHNLIHDAPHEGIYLKGNEHIIEFNEIHHVTLETGDAGAIHTGRDWTWRGNILRYNYFHHIQGPGLHGSMAVYLDDWASDFTVYGNVFYKAGRATMIGGGRDNVVENNVYVQCMPSVHVDARGLGWASYYFDGTEPDLFKKMDAMDFRNLPFSEKYPELLRLYSDEPAVPKNNKIVHNISYGGRWIDLYDYYAYNFSVVTIKDNLIADPDICRRRAKGEKAWDPYYLNIDMKEGYVTYKFGDKEIMDEFKDNTFMETDPGFVDLAHEDFRLRDDSPAYKLGFKRIPTEKIGLYKDEYRTTVPTTTH